MSDSTQIDKIRISGKELRVGAALPFNVFDKHGALLLRQGYVIRSQTMLDLLLIRANHAEKSVALSIEEQIRESDRRNKSDPLWAWDAMKTRLAGVILGNTQDFEGDIRNITHELSARAGVNADGGIFSMIRYHGGHYPQSHALHVAIICYVVAKRLQWDRNDIDSTINAALTMNIGMFQHQGTLWSQRTPLSKLQSEIIEQHPLASAQLLRERGITDQVWLNAVEDHHEMPNGQGYPLGKMDIDKPATLIRYADVFAAKISPRNYRAGANPRDALKDLFVSNGGNATDELLAAMVKEIGLYPPGTSVQLQNGEKAIVVKRNPESGHIVISYAKKDGEMLIDPMKRQTWHPQFKIIKTLPKGQEGVWLNIQQMLSSVQ